MGCLSEDPSSLMATPPLWAQRAPQLNWMTDVKRIHDTFQLPTAPDSLGPSPLKAPAPANQLFSEEPDPILQLIMRIMYAEGDLADLDEDAAVYLRDSLQIL